MPCSVTDTLSCNALYLHPTKLGPSPLSRTIQCMDNFRNDSSDKLSTYTSIVSECPMQIDRVMLHKLGRSGVELTAWLKQLSTEFPFETTKNELDSDTILKAYTLVHDNSEAVGQTFADGPEKKTLASVIQAIGAPADAVITPWKFGACLFNRKMTIMDGADGDWSRQRLVYPGTDLALIPAEHPSWTIMDPKYRPVRHTDLSVAGADPDTFHGSTVLTFNQIDRVFRVDRRSKEGNYKIVDGLPRNPRQRTGFAGRGCLQHWGPNHVGKPVVTRWCRKKSGEIRKRFGRPILEVLATRKEDGHLGIMGDKLEVGASIPANVATLLGICNNPHTKLLDDAPTSTIQFSGSAAKSMQESTDVDESEPTLTSAAVTMSSLNARSDSIHASANAKLLDQLKQGTLLYSGYIDDERNTDNAWVESTSWHLHDDDNVLDAHIGSAIEEHEEPPLFWVPVDEDTVWDRHTKELLTQAAERTNAHLNDRILPAIFEILTSIESRGLDWQGLYRLSGSKKNITRLKELCYSQASMAADVAATNDVHELTGLVKELLRSMDPPLIPFSLYGDLVRLSDCESMDEQVAAKSQLLLSLPHANFKILGLLITHLHKVADESEVNKMNMANLAVVFAPTSMRSPMGLAGDMQDQGTQCKAMCALLQTSVAELDTMSSIRNPFDAEILNFALTDEGSEQNAMNLTAPEEMFAIKKAPAATAAAKFPAAEAAAGKSQHSVLTFDDGIESDSEDNPYALPEDSINGHPEEGIYDNMAGTTETLALKDFSAIDSESDDLTFCSKSGSLTSMESAADEMTEISETTPGDVLAIEIDTSTSKGDQNGMSVKRRTRFLESEEEAANSTLDVKTSREGRRGGTHFIDGLAGLDLAGLADLNLSDAAQAFSPEGYEDDDVDEPYHNVNGAMSPKPEIMVLNPDVIIPKPAMMSPKQAMSPKPQTMSPGAEVAVKAPEEPAAATVEPTASADAGAEVAGKTTSSATVGECQECFATSVETWKDQETDQFYCKSCWDAYDEDVDVETIPATMIINVHPGKTAPTGAKSPIMQLQYDEDGLPMDSVVDDSDGDMTSMHSSDLSSRASTDQSDGYVKTGPSKPLFDEDGLPIEQNDADNEDAYMHMLEATKSPTRARRATIRINLTENLKAEELLVLASPKVKRKATKHLSKPVRAFQTRIEGVLSREVGTTWKKRYFVLHDTMLKIYKSKSGASGKATEYFNITRTSEVARFGDNIFQISIPEKGYIVTMRTSSKKVVSEWVRILSNSCRIAASLPLVY